MLSICLVGFLFFKYRLDAVAVQKSEFVNIFSFVFIYPFEHVPGTLLT